MVTMPEDVAKMSEEEKQRKLYEAENRKKIRETLKALEPLHPAGMVADNFAIEPIGTGRYIYNVCGTIGLVNADINHDNNKWFVNIEGEEVYINGHPLDKTELIFNLPDKEYVEAFAKGKIKPLTTEELYDKTKKYFKRFLDLSEEAYYDLLTIATFQSWILSELNSVFFLGVYGEYGSGKTVTIELLRHVSRHGYMPDPSVAFIGRCLDRFKVTPFIDEFDKLGELDNELYRIIRTCYRRGGTYTRMAEKGQKVESFNTFASMGFTVHGSIEDALQSRTLPIYTTVTHSDVIPRLGALRQPLGQLLYNAFLGWYISHIIDIHTIRVARVAQIIDIINNNIGEGNDESIVALLSRGGEKRATGQLEGRNVELEQVILEILGFLRFLDTGNQLRQPLLDATYKLLDLKDEIREEMRETGIAGLLHDFLINLYKKNRNNENMRTEEGLFIVSNQEVYEGFVNYCRNKGHLKDVDPGTYRGLMRDFGFSKGKNAKKMKVWNDEENKKTVRMAYIFDDRVQRVLCIKIEPRGENEKLTEHLDRGIDGHTGDEIV